MNYAMIENGVVANIIWLSPSNAADFPEAIALHDRTVAMGDSYTEGVFLRNGAPVLTDTERLTQANQEIAALDAALLDAAYENIIGGMGV